MKLHEKLCLYIVANGLKQTWVAEKIGMPGKTLNGILNGRQRLTADVLESICRKALCVEPAIFFADRFSENKNNPTGTEGDN